MAADTLPNAAAASVDRKSGVLPHQYPYPPICKFFGWQVARGGWVRLAADVMVTLGHLADHQTRSLAKQYGIRVRQCNWHGRVVDCLHYQDAARMVCGVDPARCREPP